MACGSADVPQDDGAASGSSGRESTESSSSSEGPTDGTGIVHADGTGTGSTGATGEGSDDSGEAGLGPPYPILLAHGFFGFEHLANLDFVPYWYGVPEHLAEMGEIDVCVGEVDPFNDSTERGLQLLEQAIDCAAQTGHAKVNIIAHSQGGLDARVVANLAPELVASVTTIATPHHGTPIADIVVGLVPNEDAAALVDWLVQLVGAPLWDEVGSETSLYESMLQMSQPGIAEFNETYPDAPGVLYSSVGGRTGLHDGGTDCDPTSPPPPLFITAWDDVLDTTDPLLAVSEAILSDGVIEQQPNDALVRVADTRWGEFLGCIPADHFDEIGQLLGDGAGLGNDWDHLAFYEGLVAYLRERGL